MIKALIMDCGGVIATEVPKAFMQELAVKEDLDIEELVAVWRDLFTPLVVGKLTEDEFWTRFVDRLGVEKPQETQIEEYKKLIRTLMIWDRQILTFLKEFKEEHKDIKVVLLSNSVKEWVADFQRRHDLGKYFDKTYFSFDLGERKPDQACFDKVCQDLQLKPEECILVDNNEQITIAAEKLKFVTHRYTDLNTFKRFIEKMVK